MKELKGDSYVPKLKDDSQRLLDFKLLLDKLFQVMIDYKLDYSLKWLQGLESYIYDKEHRPQKLKKHLERGHVVQVELFGHFNNELTFEHPAVVLYDEMTDEERNEGWILIAPISTTIYGDEDSLHIDLDQTDGLKHPCAARVDAIKVIDKRRVLYQFKKDEVNVKIGPEKLNAIDWSLFEKYTPKIAKDYYEITKKLNNETKQHEKTKAELELLKQKLEAAATENP